MNRLRRPVDLLSQHEQERVVAIMHDRAMSAPVVMCSTAALVAISAEKSLCQAGGLALLISSGKFDRIPEPPFEFQFPDVDSAM
jgi:hypothetical protein